VPDEQTLMTGLALGESPRWHQYRLWFSNWGMQEVVAVDLEGKSEVRGHASRGAPRAARPASASEWQDEARRSMEEATSERLVARTAPWRSV
jgi:sugar lactone lactonase YvrE